MRRVMTRVLPDPGPASTSSGPSRWFTASHWAEVRSDGWLTVRRTPFRCYVPYAAFPDDKRSRWSFEAEDFCSSYERPNAALRQISNCCKSAAESEPIFV